jgi:glycosyltransferase involved in cell wall biosynthesis
LASTSFPGYRPAAEAVVGLGTDTPPACHAGMREAFRAACPALGDRPYLLFMGRIDAKKGVDILLRAWSDLLGTYSPPSTMPVMVVAGPGWETPHGRGLLSLIEADPRLHAHVLTAGMLSGDAKWGALYGCDAFVLPSHQENFGVAVAEALSCGRPALLGRGVNIHTTVTHMRGGLSCGPERAEVARMLAGWLSLEGAERSRMSGAALRTWREHFTTRAAACRLLGAVFPGVIPHGA